MTNKSLAQSYLKKTADRLDILDLLLKKGAFSDVIREAQEIVELALKGMLRSAGIEPPKIHDVGGLLLEHRDKFQKSISEHLARLARISKKLRKERELAFMAKSISSRQRNIPGRMPGGLGLRPGLSLESPAEQSNRIIAG